VVAVAADAKAVVAVADLASCNAPGACDASAGTCSGTGKQKARRTRDPLGVFLVLQAFLAFA